MKYHTRVSFKARVPVHQRSHWYETDEPAYWAAHAMHEALITIGPPWWGEVFNINNAWLQLYQSAEQVGR